MRRPRIGVFVLLGSFALVPSLARAQVGSPQDIETSIRADGMGGATTAVGWGEPGVWGNPASLAGVRGIAWLEGGSRLLPEIDPPIRFKSRRFLAGAAGLGLSLMGEPVDGLGRARLEYNASGGTDPFGNPTVGPALTDEVDAWGIGLSPIQVVDAIRARVSPGTPSISRVVDVSVGYQHKHTRVALFPGESAENDNHDWGVLGRFGILPGDAAGRSTRVELSAGFAEINADEKSTFVSPTYGDLGPASRIRRAGAAVRVLLPFGDGPDAVAWWPGLVPSAVGLGVAYDRDEREAVGFVSSRSIDHWGFEATFMDILAARVGYVDSPYDEIHEMTGGLGLHVPLGPWATAGYDWANVPSVQGMKNANRHAWSVWLHPDAFWKARRAGP